MEHRGPLQAKGRGLCGFVLGATYPVQALRLFQKHPQLRSYVLIPLLVNVIVGGSLYAGLLFAGFHLIDALILHLSHWLSGLPAPTLPSPTLPTWTLTLPTWLTQWTGWIQSWFNQLPDLGSWLTTWFDKLPGLPDWFGRLPNWAIAIVLWLVHAVLVVILLLLTGYILLQFGVLLGAPWYGKLSEELEQLQLGQLPLVEAGLTSTLRDIGRAVLYELKKLVLMIGVGVLLLLCNFLPGIGTAIATIGGVTLAATLVCLDFLDAALERRRLRFREKLGFILKTLPDSASFGFVCLGLVSIPFLNLLVIPVCVSAGTLFFCDRLLKPIDTSRTAPEH
ncbi:MAG TPA: EI24 domain-containing protein [Crinalium sp.]|jgi:CysZ protein